MRWLASRGAVNSPGDEPACVAVPRRAYHDLPAGTSLSTGRRAGAPCSLCGTCHERHAAKLVDAVRESNWVTHVDVTGLLSHLSGPAYLTLGALFALAAMGIPVPVPVSGLLVTLGALSAQPGGPNLAVIVAVSVIALSSGHVVDYGVGRAGSPLLWRALRALERRLGRELITRLEAALERGGSWLILLTRFLFTPLASPVSLLAGAARIRFVRYLGLEVFGQVLYVCGYLALGRLLGPTLASGGLALLFFALVLAVVVVAPALLLRLGRGLLKRVA